MVQQSVVKDEPAMKTDEKQKKNFAAYQPQLSPIDSKSCEGEVSSSTPNKSVDQDVEEVASTMATDGSSIDEQKSGELIRKSTQISFLNHFNI